MPPKKRSYGTKDYGPHFLLYWLIARVFRDFLKIDFIEYQDGAPLNMRLNARIQMAGAQHIMSNKSNSD